jgi:putative sigma-54 modulation protein
MSINITFRHIEATESIKSYASEKVGKLQKFLRQPMTAKVTISIEKHERMAEVRLSSGSEHYEAHEVHDDDLYAAIDKVVDKLERQINSSNSKGRRSGETLRGRPEDGAD